MLEYFKTGLMNPRDNAQARKMSRKQLVGYFAMLALLITLSLSSVITSLMTHLRNDGQEIASSIPAFEVTKGQLNTEDDQESFIHQTNSFLFFFDPNDSIALEEVESNIERLNVPIGVALLENGFYLNVTGQTLPLTYEQIDGFTQDNLVQLFNQIGSFSPLVLLFIFVIAYLASSFTLLYEWLIVALMANIISTLLRVRSPFKTSARVALVSLTIPTVVLSIIEAFGFYLPFAFEIKLGFALYFVYTSFKKIAPPKKKAE